MTTHGSAPAERSQPVTQQARSSQPQSPPVPPTSAAGSASEEKLAQARKDYATVCTHSLKMAGFDGYCETDGRRLIEVGPFADEVTVYQMMHDQDALALFVPQMKSCGFKEIEFWDGKTFGLYQVYSLETFERVT